MAYRQVLVSNGNWVCIWASVYNAALVCTAVSACNAVLVYNAVQDATLV